MLTDRQPSTAGHDRDVRRAWWSLALFLPSFVAAFVTGEGLLAALGHSDDPTVPTGIALAAGLPAIAVFTLPTVVVWYFGHRAEQRGQTAGRAPIIVALVISGAFLASNLLQLVARLLLE